MPDPSVQPSQRKPVRTDHPARRDAINSGLGGAGGGAGIVAAAHGVGLNSFTGQVLLYFAPVFSVAASSFLYMIRNQASWYVEKWQVNRARRTIAKSLTDPHTSDEHKEKIRKMLEELDSLAATSELDRISLLGKQ